MRLIKNFIFFLLIIPSVSFAVEKKYDVVSIGKAMVDLIQHTSEEELKEIMPQKFKKGDSNKIDNHMANKIFAKMHDITTIPGGSEANVMVNIASLGGKTAFNAIAANDELGILFKESMIKAGVTYTSPFVQSSIYNTARCFTFITPDKERTFAVALDIVKGINDSFINYDDIKEAKIFYTDASNIDHGKNQSKITLKALSLAKKNSTLTSFNLNNNYYVENYRKEIISLLPKIDIIVSGELEAKNLFKVETKEEAIAEYLKHAKIAIITQGKKGAIIATKDEQISIPAIADPAKIVDLNGAGDGFVAGFLYGYTHGYSLKDAGSLGAKTATYIIYQLGARPKDSLKKAIL